MMSSLAKIPVNPFSGYTLCAPGTEACQDDFIGVVLNIFLNILEIKALDRSKKYQIRGDLNDKVEVYSINKETKAQQIELGWDKKAFVWYSGYTSSWKFQDFLNTLSMLTEVEITQTSPQMQPFILKAQEGVLGFLKNELQLIPSYFAFQEKDFETFASLPRAHVQVPPKNIAGFQVTNLPDTLEVLLERNRGVLLGFYFSAFDAGLSTFLCAQMQRLYDANVRHIYDQISATACFAAYEKFNSIALGSSDDGSTELMTHLRSVDDQYAEAKLQFFRAAQRLGIKVWPIESSYTPKDLADARKVLGGIMVRNIDYYANMLQPGEKFLSLNGAAFYSIAEALGIPTIRISCTSSQGFEVLSNALLQAPGSFENIIDKMLGRPFAQHFSALAQTQKINSNLQNDRIAEDFAKFEKKGFDFIATYELGNMDKAIVEKVDQQQTELMIACQDENFAKVKELLANGAKFTEQDTFGRTAFMIAKETQNLEIINYLHDTAMVNYLCNAAKDTPTLCKRVDSLGDDAKRLINTPYIRGWTVLHYTAYAQNFQALEYLVKKGGDITLKTQKGKTPIDYLEKKTEIAWRNLPTWGKRMSHAPEKPDNVKVKEKKRQAPQLT